MTMIPGNARHLPFRSSIASVAVTSPPYLEQRRYGPSADEIGSGVHLEQYVADLVAVAAEIRRVLRPNGSLWLNIGDKANGSGGAGGDWTGPGGPGRYVDPAYPVGTFLDVPGAVLRGLLADGWRLRLPIVWDKGREAPEDLRHVRRPRWSHEMIYLLAPGPDRIRFYPSALTETGSVWHFPPGGSGPAHLAPFPDELARRAILATTLPGDLVLDPFAGSGTVDRVARSLGRRAIGTDLYPPERTP